MNTPTIPALVLPFLVGILSAGCTTHTVRLPDVTGFDLSGKVMACPAPDDAPRDGHVQWYRVNLALVERHADGTCQGIYSPIIVMSEDHTARLEVDSPYGEVNSTTWERVWPFTFGKGTLVITNTGSSVCAVADLDLYRGTRSWPLPPQSQWHIRRELRVENRTEDGTLTFEDGSTPEAVFASFVADVAALATNHAELAGFAGYANNREAKLNIFFAGI